MRNIIMTLLLATALCSLAVAGNPAQSKAAVGPVNNVVKMDTDGHRTALCCCKMEVPVTDKSPTLDHDGTTFYMCSEACKNMAMKASKEEMGKMMADWHEKYATYVLPTNTFVKDGKLLAKCGCGKEFELTDESPRVIENGHATYLCSQACYEGFTKMSAADRLEREMAIVKENSESMSR